MSRNAVILGGGQSKWGVREAHLMDLFQEAGKACLDDIPGLKPLDIDGLIVATSYAGRCSFQVNVPPMPIEKGKAGTIMAERVFFAFEPVKK